MAHATCKNVHNFWWLVLFKCKMPQNLLLTSPITHDVNDCKQQSLYKLDSMNSIDKILPHMQCIWYTDGEKERCIIRTNSLTILCIWVG